MGRASSRSEAHGARRRWAFWLVGTWLENGHDIQLRDSAGLAPDFPRLVAYELCASSIGPTLH